MTSHAVDPLPGPPDAAVVPPGSKSLTNGLADRLEVGLETGCAFVVVRIGHWWRPDQQRRPACLLHPAEHAVQDRSTHRSDPARISITLLCTSTSVPSEPMPAL